MNREAVQHERGPRNSTLRRQMSLYFKEQQQQQLNLSPTSSERSPPPSSTSSRPTLSHSISKLASPSPTAFQPLPTPPSAPPSLPLPPSLPPPLHPLGAAIDFTNGNVRPPLPHPLPFLVDPRILAASAVAAAVPSTPLFRPSLVAPKPKYPHELTPPAATSSVQADSAADAISETAARLLVMNLRWAQHVPAFVSLPYLDQLTLLKETWRELFVLSAAQFALPVELAAASMNPEEERKLIELKALQDAIGKFRDLHVDPTEFACLRAVVLLRSSLDGQHELRDRASVSALQDQAQMALSQYVQRAYPQQPQRFGKLLLLLPELKTISGENVRAAFFRALDANAPMEKIVVDVFKGQVV